MSNLPKILRWMGNQFHNIGHKFELEQAADLIESQRKENDELKAYCHRLEVFITRTVEKVPNTPETHWIYPSMLTLKRALRFKASTCLAEVKAQAFEEAAEIAKESPLGIQIQYTVPDWLKSYAAKLREEGE